MNQLFRIIFKHICLTVFQIKFCAGFLCFSGLYQYLDIFFGLFEQHYTFKDITLNSLSVVSGPFHYI